MLWLTVGARGGARRRWSARFSGRATDIIGLWMLTLFVSGGINALFYESINAPAYHSSVFMAMPLVVSILVVFFVAPRVVKDTVRDEK